MSRHENRDRHVEDVEGIEEEMLHREEHPDNREERQMGDVPHDEGTFVSEAWDHGPGQDPITAAHL